MSYSLSPFASLIQTPPTEGSWNAVLVDNDATAIDARPLALDDYRRYLASTRRCFEIGLAPRSEHNLVASFDGVEGLFVATYDELEEGTMVALTVHLPGGEVIETLGMVEFVRSARCRDATPGVGLRFQGLDQVDAARLGRFAQLREPMFYC